MNKSEYENIYRYETHFWWYVVLHDLVIRYVKRIGKGKNLSILDAGCGTGRMLELLSEYGDATGIDNSDEAVGFSKSRGQSAEIIDLNLWKPEKKYDLIISLDVLYHSDIKDDTFILENFYKALAPQGYLILNLPAFELLRRGHDEVVKTRHRYTKKEINEKLVSCGFSIMKSTYRLPHAFLIILFLKLVFIRRNIVKSDVSETQDWLNRFFCKLGIAENRWIIGNGSIPVGSSVFIVAFKSN
jgi:SAM-dependent methyltransferase